MSSSYQQETYPAMIDFLSNITPPDSEDKMLSSTSTDIAVKLQQKVEEDDPLSIPLPSSRGLVDIHPTDDLVAHKEIIPSNSSSEQIENDTSTPVVEDSSQLPLTDEELLTDKLLDTSYTPTPDLVVNSAALNEFPGYMSRIDGVPEMGHNEVNVMADAHKTSIDNDDTFIVDMISSSLVNNNEPLVTVEAPPETLATIESVVDTTVSPELVVEFEIDEEHGLAKGLMPSESSDAGFLGDVVSIDDSARASHESTVDTTVSHCKSIDAFVAAQLSASLMNEKDDDKDQYASAVDDSIDIHSIQLGDKTFGFDDYMMLPSPTIYHDALDATFTFESRTSELSDTPYDSLLLGADAVSPPEPVESRIGAVESSLSNTLLPVEAVPPVEPDQMVQSRISEVESSDSSIYEDALE
jgi:hypothetical protein